MHPEIRRNRSGICPECGMALVESSHEKAREGHSTGNLKTKFWVSLILSFPIVMYSHIVEDLTGWTVPAFPGSIYLPFVLGSIIFFYAGRVFLVSAWRELKARTPGMMTLISLAIIVAYVYSVAMTFIGSESTLYWELSTLIAVMLLGHWVEMRAVSGAQGALKALSDLLPDTAELLKGEEIVEVNVSEMSPGDIIMVRPGSRVPADGVIKKGTSHLDESMVTGESVPVLRNEGDELIAGTINGDGVLTVEVAKIGEDTFLSGVMRLVEEAQASKSNLQLLSDRAAYYLTLIAVTVAGLTFVWWVSSDTTVFAIERTVAVLVIACPHALGLAIPLVASISTTKAANNGFLIRERAALEKARMIDTVVFDKTGTLTEGSYGVTDVWTFGVSEAHLLGQAASIESFSEHPIAKAIVEKARSSGIELSKTDDVRTVPGIGMKGSIGKDNIEIGGKSLAEDDNLNDDILKAAKQGKTIIYVRENGNLIGVFACADVIRAESRQAVMDLKRSGLNVAMMTGDDDNVADYVASELGIDEFYSRVMPDMKSSKVEGLQKDGRKVAMVGDGINDAPALARADLGIAIGAGTNVAIESAGIILMRNDPRDVSKIISLSKMTYSKMVQNLFWATGYNVVAMPLAAGVLISQGVVLQPAFAAALMSVSTVVVAANALLLRNKDI